MGGCGGTAGVTRERLESFDRPILVEPNDFPDKRGALISEFRNYLGILKAVHSGADLQASAQVPSPSTPPPPLFVCFTASLHSHEFHAPYGAADCLPGSVKGHLGYVLSHQRDNVILPLIENAVEARLELQPHLPGNRSAALPAALPSAFPPALLDAVLAVLPTAVPNAFPNPVPFLQPVFVRQCFLLLFLIHSLPPPPVVRVCES
eukprot:jgi/Botrbrau1/21925/Bobra.0249s0049.1